MAKIYTFGNTKGGSGNSTLAIQSALGLALRGHNVWFVGGHSSGSGLRALTLRRQRGDQTPDTANYPTGRELRAQVTHQADRYDFVIIDAGGSDNRALRGALAVADAVIVPFRPEGFDIWALPGLNTFLLEIMDMRDGLDVYALINQADLGEPENDEAIEVVSKFHCMKLMKQFIGNREVIAAASGQGRHVSELGRSDNSALAAEQETDAIVDQIESGRFHIHGAEM